jgi:hypothetical protein
MATGPKWSRGALDLINNTYVVRNSLLYEYYPISVLPYKDTDPFIKLEVSPGVISEGVAVFGGKAYDVSVSDLFRRRINVRKQRLSTPDDNVGETGKSNGESKERREVQDHTNEQRLSDLFGDEVSEVADMAWENQVDSLLQTFHSQEGEEFEITSTTQSGRVDEGGAVPNTLENIG